MLGKNPVKPIISHRRYQHFYFVCYPWKSYLFTPSEAQHQLGILRQTLVY